MSIKRVENKYIFNINSKQKVINKILSKGYKEIYSERQITSIYFDTLDYKSYTDSIEGNIPRKKFRVRSYDNFNSNFNFEIKEVNEYGRFKFSKKIVEIPNEITDNIYQIIYPVIEIEYKRLYFSDDQIRLTLDFNIKYRSLVSDTKYDTSDLILESKLSDGVQYDEEINNYKVFGENNVSFSKYKEAINKIIFFGRNL